MKHARKAETLVIMRDFITDSLFPFSFIFRSVGNFATWLKNIRRIKGQY